MNSQNGWPVVNATQLDRSPIPNTGIIPVPGTLGGDVAWLLRWVGEQFDRRVMKLYNPGCWGWNAPVVIPGSNIYSNHASGTAVDFNAPTFPWKTRNMSPEQRAACRAISAETEHVVAWGGDFTTLIDEMHFEINGSSEDVSRVVNKLKGGTMNQEEVDKIYKNIDNINKRLDKELSNLYKVIDAANKRLDRQEAAAPEEIKKISKAITDFKEAVK